MKSGRNCWNLALDFVELGNDQSREMINTRQRYQAWRSAAARERGFRGSMVWETSKGQDYLFRAYYADDGKRRQKSLGRRSPETEAMKSTFEEERASAIASRKRLDEVLGRQAAVNRALGMGRVPMIAARILRMLDQRGFLGKGLKVVGTNALYGYEAAGGVFFDPGITTTGDLDLLLDARGGLNLMGRPEISDDGLIGLLRRIDRSFRKSRQSFRAENDEGYLVDLITPLRRPPWGAPSPTTGPDALEAAEIEGLSWLENAPTFEQVALDERGAPLRLVTIDPRVFAIHKHWIANRPDRDPLKRRRDAEQARTVAALTRRYLGHLPFEASELLMLPRAVVDDAMAGLATAG